MARNVLEAQALEVPVIVSTDGGLRELIHLLKYNGVRPAAAVLGRMLVDAARLRRRGRLTGRLAEHWLGANPT